MTRLPRVRQLEIERACRAVLKATGTLPTVTTYPDGRVIITPSDHVRGRPANLVRDTDGGAEWDAALARD